jgi:hypothetical protein
VAIYYHGKSYTIILTKNGLGYILGGFFTNASGHPARDRTIGSGAVPATWHEPSLAAKFSCPLQETERRRKLGIEINKCRHFIRWSRFKNCGFKYTLLDVGRARALYLIRPRARAQAQPRKAQKRTRKFSPSGLKRQKLFTRHESLVSSKFSGPRVESLKPD